MIMLNSSLNDQTVKTDRFSDIIGSFTTGTDVITSKSFNLNDAVTIPAKGEYILELGK